MKKLKNKFKLCYLLFAIGLFSLSTVGATYAYWASSASSSDNAINTSSTGYSISISITPLYHGFSTIPMDDEDMVKAISNECLDKYDRGACSAYVIDVNGFNENTSVISGAIKFSTNIENLSYAIMDIENNNTSSDCSSLSIDDEVNNYCLYGGYNRLESDNKEDEHILFSSYDVTGVDSTKFILVIWLSNENRSQNDDGIGSFTASVEISIGSGGVIEGVISDAVITESA